MKHAIAKIAPVALMTIAAVAAFAQEPAGKKRQGGQPVVNSKEADLAAIRAESQAFVDAFNKRDAKAIAELWTEDAEYSDDLGRRYVGRDAIEKSYAAFFADSPQATLRVMIDSLRLLGDSTAIEDGRAVVEPPPAGAPGFSKYAAVHVKVGGKWRMASVRDSYVDTPSTYRSVADLEFLIGTWKAEEHGNKIESVFGWVSDKSFVERRYTITHHDGVKTSGVQMIGWNPLNGRIQSWDFSPNGGLAVGIWTPHDGGWTAEMNGVTADAVVTTSVNRLTRLDDNAYVWQSVQRTAGGVPLPDTDEIVMKRQPAAQ